jgi:hypothetical protein
MTLPSMGKRHGYRDAIIERARSAYGRPRAKPERAVAHFLASSKERRLATIARAMKQKPAFSTDSPGVRFTKHLNEL